MDSTMVTDSITNASIPMAASNAKDLVKKKRANRSAKLKQCKLDARREQWLSQVKNKETKEETNGRGGYSARSMHAHNENNRSMVNLEIKPLGEENDGSNHHFSDSESSPSNSPTSHASSVLGGTESGTNFTGSSSSSSSSSSGGCCSGSISEEEGDDECLDDWEAVADALAAIDDKQEQQNHNSELPDQQPNITHSDSRVELPHLSASGTVMSKPNPETVLMVQQKAPPNGRAWRSDDAFRPQCLPNLAKQRSFPMNSDRHCGRAGVGWGCKSVLSAPCSCPICYEDLDSTDSSFLPCACGFRLCLFCHKRILEEDGRCPGCRKQYDHDANEGKAKLARSYSMITRS